MTTKLEHQHDEANVIYTDGYGRQVQCGECKLLYFIDAPMDEPDDERSHQFGHD